MKHFLETSNALKALVLNLLDHLDTTENDAEKWVLQLVFLPTFNEVTDDLVEICGIR